MYEDLEVICPGCRCEIFNDGINGWFCWKCFAEIEVLEHE